MTENRKPVAAGSEMFCRGRWMAAGMLALALLLPSAAFAMDSTPRHSFDQAGQALQLPPVRYLESMRWMDWKPAAPVFKVDTLLLPDLMQPDIFRLPSGYDRDLARVS
jgi:hypothetical protein